MLLAASPVGTDECVTGIETRCRPMPSMTQRLARSQVVSGLYYRGGETGGERGVQTAAPALGTLSSHGQLERSLDPSIPVDRLFGIAWACHDIEGEVQKGLTDAIH